MRVQSSGSCWENKSWDAACLLSRHKSPPSVWFLRVSPSCLDVDMLVSMFQG